MGLIISDILNVDDVEFSEKELLEGYLLLVGKSELSIFLDDIRLAPDKYDTTFKNAESLLEFLKQGISKVQGASIDVLSLDHDLGLDIMDGYDFVKAFVELDIPIKRIQLHTDNMVGFKNMYYYLISAQEHGLLSKDTVVEPRKVSVVDGVETILYRPV